jgi:hypothetical protein
MLILLLPSVSFKMLDVTKKIMFFNFFCFYSFLKVHLQYNHINLYIEKELVKRVGTGYHR